MKNEKRYLLDSIYWVLDEDDVNTDVVPYVLNREGTLIKCLLTDEIFEVPAEDVSLDPEEKLEKMSKKEGCWVMTAADFCDDYILTMNLADVFPFDRAYCTIKEVEILTKAFRYATRRRLKTIAKIDRRESRKEELEEKKEAKREAKQAKKAAKRKDDLER